MYINLEQLCIKFCSSSKFAEGFIETFAEKKKNHESKSLSIFIGKWNRVSEISTLIDNNLKFPLATVINEKKKFVVNGSMISTLNILSWIDFLNNDNCELTPQKKKIHDGLMPSPRKNINYSLYIFKICVQFLSVNL